MHEALDRAKRELGQNVRVLHTRLYDEPAMFGLSRSRGVEILAAVDTSDPAISVVTHRGAPAEDLGSMAKEVADIKQILAKMTGPGRLDEEPPTPIVARLMKHGVATNVAETVARQCNLVQDERKIINIIEPSIICAGPIRCEKRQARAVLVGPTGVGKTTTAAKLAANYSMVQNKKVALLTLDTYRVGAVEQLASYARIIDVPMEVALCPEDVDALIKKHKDKDVIIIDTVGRSQRSGSQLAELARFVRAANPTEVHMVVSASSSEIVQKEAVGNFRQLGIDRTILTKLDECPLPGCILDLAVSTLLPYSYITFGQEVPDDISVAQPQRLARLVWEGMP